VERFEQVRGPLLAGLLWSALALASGFARDAGGAIVLVWLPSAVCVAGLYATAPRRWPALIATLFAVQVGLSSWHGTPIVSAIGFAFANQVEAVLCATLGIRVLGGRARSPQSFNHVAGLFAAALVGCAAGTLLSLPFRAGASLEQPLRWFLASVLGVLTATPALLYLRQWLGFGDQNVRFWEGERQRGFLLTMTAMLILGWLILSLPVRGLTPVMFVAIVFAVFRYGQLAAAPAG
jgi:integral membrane sensor domain MASE1